MRYLKISLVIFALSWVISDPVHAAAEYQRESLRMLQGVTVLIEDINSEVVADGLSQSQIQTDVELILRTSGIRVLTTEEAPKSPRGSFLYINVNILRNRESYAYSITVQLAQVVSLNILNTNVPTIGYTWQKSMIGTIGKSKLSEVRKDVEDIIKMFANDFLAMNPR